MYKLEINTENGTTTLEATTAHKMLLSLAEFGYIDTSLNDGIIQTIKWLLEPLAITYTKTTNRFSYIINDGSSMVSFRYDKTGLAVHKTSSSYLITRTLKGAI